MDPIIINNTTLGQMHSKLDANFIRAVQDEKDAKDLQEFFNYIVYDEAFEEKGKNPFQKLVTSTLKEELQNSQYVKNLHINYKEGVRGHSINDLGRYGEEGFSFLITSAISILENNGKLEKDLNDSLSNMLKGKKIEDSIIGDMQATMLSKTVLKSISNEAVKQGNKKAFQSLFKKYGVFALRQGKIDINMSQLDLTVNSNSYAKRLAKLTSSVKNYNKNLVSLENVSVLKAMQGFFYAMTRQRDVKKINDSYTNILKPKLSDENILPHIEHIVNLYALTGMGQVYINKVTKQMIESKLGAKFFMVNQRASKKIYVIPTSSLGWLGLHKKEFGKNIDVGFRYGKYGNQLSANIISPSEKHAYIKVSLNVDIASSTLKGLDKK